MCIENVKQTSNILNASNILKKNLTLIYFHLKHYNNGVSMHRISGNLWQYTLFQQVDLFYIDLYFICTTWELMGYQHLPFLTIQIIRFNPRTFYIIYYYYR